MSEKEEDKGTAGPPWSWQPSLEVMAEEAGVDFDSFIEALEQNLSDQEIARELSISPKVITFLREHFEHYGIDSVFGQD